MIEKPRKLIFFWPYLEWGGAQIYFLAIVKESQPDWDVTVVLPRTSSAEMIRFIEQSGAKIELLDFHSDMDPAPTIRRKLLRQYHRIKVEIASFRFLRRYDLNECILHIEFPPWQSWIFFTALSLRRANVFMTMHNALPSSPAWRVAIWKLRLQFVSRLPGFHIFTSNKDTKNKLRGWVAEKFWDNIKVTYTCVNPPEIDSVKSTQFNRTEFRQKHGISSDKLVVLCVGQFIDRKGRWAFLDAAKLVTQEHKDIQFVWLTPKLPTESEQTRIDAYELGDNFKLVLSSTVGPSHKDVLLFFRTADIFALASFIEGLPIAILEAMALGIPSISTNVFAIPEAVKHLETGMLIEAGDAIALAEAITKLKYDENLRSHLSQNGSEYVLQNFDERVASQIALSAYKECLRNAG